jgi:hypothetical protein
MTAVVIVAAVLAACALLLVRRVRLRASLQALADSTGAWSAAGGGSLGPLAITAGASPSGAAWSAHVLGRRLARGRARVAPSRLEPAAALRTARGVLRRVRFESVRAHVHGAAEDPATSALLAGWIAAASAAVFPRAHVETDVDWLADAPHVRVDCNFVASFVPLLVGLDLARLATSRARGLPRRRATP